MEHSGGCKYVYKHMCENYPRTASILEKLNDSVSELRNARNKIAHQEGFSTKNLVVIQAMETDGGNFLSEVSKVMTPEKLRALVREEISSDFKPVIPKMESVVKDLIDSLSPVYKEVLIDA